MKAAVVAAIAALESRTAELRHAEAELEAIRQSHYAANDALHAAQGALGEAALDVSRLEERIRYVAEGRQRIARQRADLDLSTRPGCARQAEARTEGEGVAARIAGAEQAAAGFVARIEEHAAIVEAAQAALREAQAASDGQREVVAGVQQQIQVAAAEMRGVDEQSAQAEGRRDRLLAEEKGLAPIDPAASTPPGSAPRPPSPSTALPKRASRNGRKKCPRSTRPGAPCRPRRTTRRTATPISPPVWVR